MNNLISIGVWLDVVEVCFGFFVHQCFDQFCRLCGVLFFVCFVGVWLSCYYEMVSG